jgi:Pregnancy-associated plasma protein-A/Secretion system C-terminal sorting domain/Right handed beta helix region
MNNNQVFTSVTIPVIVHVLYRGGVYESYEKVSDEDIASAIQTLNDDFAGTNGDLSNLPSMFNGIKAGDTNIRFCLDPLIRKTEIPVTTDIGITNVAALQDLLDGISPPPDRNFYLNIYIVPRISTGLFGTALGVGTFPWYDSSENIGILLSTDAVKNSRFKRIITHEAGHWLGLIHIWGDEPDCTADDNVSDTPLQGDKHYGIVPGLPTSCGNGGDMHMNHMDYSDNRYVFSNGQKLKMQSVFSDYPLRQNIGTNSCVLMPYLSASTTSICEQTEPPSQTVTLTVNDYNIGARFEWYENDAIIPISGITGNNYTITPAQNVRYRVKVIYTDPTLNRTTAFIKIMVGYAVDSNPNSITTYSVTATSSIGGSLVGNSVYLWSPTSLPILKGNIIIPEGISLEIDDLDLTMPPNTKIIVEPGAFLKINKSNFTACNGLWQGIEVQSSASPIIKGRIEMIASSIEHAKTAIISGGKFLILEEPGVSYYSYENGGARMSIERSTFRNNETDIYFSLNSMPNTTSRQANINECNFITNGAYRSLVSPIHININYDKGIEILNIGIVNEMEPVRNPTYKGIGILSFKSTYSLSATGLLLQPRSYLNGLEYGIKAYQGIIGKTVDIQKTAFENSKTGLYAFGFNSALGLKVHDNLYHDCTESGVYIDRCKRFNIYTNLFAQCKHAIIARETGASNNIIQGNTLKNDVQYGISAMGVNRGGSTRLTGLQMHCNTFDCERDIWIDGTKANGLLPPGSATLNPKGGIRATQGDLVNPINGTLNTAAGNTFLRVNQSYASVHKDVYYNASTLCRYYYPNNVGSEYIPTNIVQNSSFPNQFSTQSIPVTALCPPYIPVSMTLADAWQQRNMALFEQTTLQNTLDNLEDGGDTPLTKNEILMANLQNSYQLYATLMAKSPYLSEEILEELAQKENFPKPLLRDIMVANKHAGKNVEVWQKLNSRSDELPEYMLNQIESAAQSGWSAKEFLEYQIAQKSELYHNAIATQISLLDSDNTATLADYDAVLATANDENYQKELVEMAMYYNDAIAAEQYLDAISNIGTTTEETQAIQDYKALKMVLIGLQNANKPLQHATTAERNALAALADDTNEASAEARVLWERLGNTTAYKEPYPLSVNNSQQRLKASKKTAKDAHALKTAPNPAQDYITFELTSTESTPAHLYIYDAQGRVVETIQFTNTFTLNTAHFSNGIYFYKYTDDNGLNTQGKINIQH